jgi:HK97 family phage major capsid protein
MDELNELQSITHEYRKSLAAYEARTGRATHTVDSQGSGEERQKFARMDADLTAAEILMQNKALEARLARLESVPEFESRAPKGRVAASDPASPEYAHRWLKAIVNGDTAEFRALSLGSTNAAIPVDLERRIVEKKQMVGVIRGVATVNRVNSNRNIAIENALPTSAWIAEEAAQTASDPTFSAQVQVRARTLRCSTILSQQFIEDAIGTGDVGTGMDYVARKMAISLALKEEEAFTIGNPAAAVPEPDGLCRNAGTVAQGVDLGSGAALTTTTYDNIIDAAHTVAPEYRNGPQVSWLVSDSFLRHARKLRSASSPSDYLWLPAGAPNSNALTVGVAGTIYGFPYRVGKYVPTATADGAVYAIFGNFEYYEIFDRTGITALMDPYSLQANLQTRLNVYQRLDAKITLPEAFAYIRG